MRKKSVLTVIICIICLVCSIFITINRTNGILKRSSENEHRVVSGLVSNALINAFIRPITVSNTMSKDINLIHMLSCDTRQSAKDVEYDMAVYLRSISNGFGYPIIFSLSDKSKAYFSTDGISRYVDDTLETSDIWYKEFTESIKDYKLDVDFDEFNNWSLSVFINTSVFDENHNYIGVCGVGIDMTDLQRQLEKYERIYNVKIDVINRDGLIQMDTSSKAIEHDYIEIDNLEELADGECYYEIKAGGNRTITYIKDLDWFLIVQEKGTSQQLNSIVLPNVICLCVGILLIIIINCVILTKKESD